MAKPRLNITPKNRPASARRKAAVPPAPDDTDDKVTIKALRAIVGMEYGVLRGGVIRIPRAEAEALVEAGHAIYSGTPIETALGMLKDRGCGIALPARPDGEVLAAATTVGIPIVDM